MPREKVTCPAGVVQVGWGKDEMNVQLAVVPAGQRVKTHLDSYRIGVRNNVPCSFCGAAETQVCTKPRDGGGTVALDYVHDDRSLAYEEWLASSPPPFLDLDRPGLNRLVRILRRARDEAYGRDE